MTTQILEERTFADRSFRRLGEIEIARGHDGACSEEMPQARYAKAGAATLNAYGAGPFCKFKIGKGYSQPGLYVLTLNGAPVYAGECDNIADRWGPKGYGSIQPRNCYKGGQETNCRINAAILAAAKASAKLELWFAPVFADRRTRRHEETRLIRAFQPAWNRAKLK